MERRRKDQYLRRSHTGARPGLSSSGSPQLLQVNSGFPFPRALILIFSARL